MFGLGYERVLRLDGKSPFATAENTETSEADEALDGNDTDASDPEDSDKTDDETDSGSDVDGPSIAENGEAGTTIAAVTDASADQGSGVEGKDNDQQSHANSLNAAEVDRGNPSSAGSAADNLNQQFLDDLSQNGALLVGAGSRDIAPVQLNFDETRLLSYEELRHKEILGFRIRTVDQRLQYPFKVMPEDWIRPQRALEYPSICQPFASGTDSALVYFQVDRDGLATNAGILAHTDPCFSGEALYALSNMRFHVKENAGNIISDSIFLMEFSFVSPNQ